MNEKTITFLLSLVSGFVDTAGFIALGGVFTAHVTGNFVLAGASLVRFDSEGVLPKLLMFPIFVVAVGVTYLISQWIDGSKGNALISLMGLEALFLCLFAVLGCYFQPSISIKMLETQVIAIGALGVIAMAIQNAFMRLHLGKLTMTTVMTGNVTQFSIDLANCVFRLVQSKSKTEDSAEIRLRLKKFGVVILGFLLGAILGAIMVFNFSLLSVLFPAGLVLLTAFQLAKSKALKSGL